MARFIRTTTFVRKELLEIWRQPKLLLTLVVGPFVILGLFGAGLRDEDPPVDYLVVGPESGAVRDLAEGVIAVMPSRMTFEGYLTSEDEALEAIRRGDVDLVISLPSDPAQSVSEGRRAVIRVYHDVVDPIESRAVGLASQQAGDRVNRVLSRRVVEQSQDVVGDASEQMGRVRASFAELEAAVGGAERETVAAAQAGVQREVAELAILLQAGSGLVAALDSDAPSLAGPLASLRATAEEDVKASEDVARLERAIDRLDSALATYRALPSEVVVSPFVGVARGVGPGSVGLTAFYAPAVVVVLVQHMLISFLTLSMVREQDLGTVDMFRIAPLTAGEILAGKYLAYLVLGVATMAVLTGLLVVGLGVPVRGSPGLLIVAALLTFLAAIALGFVLSMLAESTSQAVQLSMLVLLASIFFSGFILSLTRFHPPLNAVSRGLPATYGVSMFRDVMLRGRNPAPVDLLGLAAMALVLTGLAWVLLRRRLQHA